MSEPTIVKPAVVEDRPNPSVTPEISHSGGGPVQNEPPQGDAAESLKTLKTLKLLREWPIVLFVLNKGESAYKSVKCSTKITEAGLGITEKVLTNFAARSANVIQKITPVVNLVDYSASESLERLQKYFPIVKESPEKIYDSVVGRLVKVISPAVNTAVAVTEDGRKRVTRTVKTLVKASRKVMIRVENRLERFEQYVAEKELETATDPSVPASTSQESSPPPEAAVSTWSSKVRLAARSGLCVALSLWLFWVGATCWLLERLPLVGRLFSETAAPAAGPRRPSTAATSSSYSSLAEEPAPEEAESSPLPPQLSQATQ